MELPIILGKNDTRAVRTLCLPEIHFLRAKRGMAELTEASLTDKLLYELGFDVAKGVEKYQAYQVSPILKKKCYGIFVTGWERQDAEWIDSGYASEAGKIAVKNDPSYIREIISLGGGR